MAGRQVAPNWEAWYAQVLAHHEADLRAAKRRPVTSWRYIVTCRLCGAECYRREHIKRRTDRLYEALVVETRWAWLRHERLAGHDRHSVVVRLLNGEIAEGAAKLDGMVKIGWENERG